MTIYKKTVLRCSSRDIMYTYPHDEYISSKKVLSACGYRPYSFCLFSWADRSGCDILDLISCWARERAYCSSVIRVILEVEVVVEWGWRAGLTPGDVSRITCNRSSDCKRLASSSSITHRLSYDIIIITVIIEVIRMRVHVQQLKINYQERKYITMITCSTSTARHESNRNIS